MTFDERVVEAARQVAAAVEADVLAGVGVQRAVVTMGVAGAGKSTFVENVTGAARHAEHRVAVCAPTNAQAFDLTARLARRYPSLHVTLVPASKVDVPAWVTRLDNVREARPANQANDASIIVGTFDKLGDAVAREDLDPVDLLIGDESFQADSARYYAVAGLATTHLLVGDPGQLNPFSTVDDDDRWRGLPEDPLQTAVGILLRNHAATTPVYRLPITRRLDHRAAPLARAFYPGHPFDSAVLPGVRRLRLLPSVAADTRTRLVDRSIELAAEMGWAHLELPAAPVLTADPETIELIIQLLTRLRDRSPQVQCERQPRLTTLAPQRIAVGVSHNDQRDLLRVALDGTGLQDVVVSTANKLQGLEFDLVIAWHPLGGLPDPDGFHLDPGRLCVLLTRHRHACIVVGRTGDRGFLDGLPPRTPAYLGWDPDPVLDGWGMHQAVFEHLEAFNLAA